MNRVFWNGNESHSRNLGINRAGGAITDVVSLPSPSLPSQEQRAYQSYATYARRIGAPIMSFERWYAKDCGIGNEMFANYLAFHGESLKDVGRHDLPWGIHGSRVRPRVDEWDGGWDNVIRTLEDQR